MKRFVLLALGACLSTSAPLNAETVQPVKAAVIRSQGTIFLNMTIWPELNSGWSNFGDTPVSIDYASLGGYGWGLPQIRATGADVLIFSVPGFLSYTAAEIAAVKQYVEEGHGLIITYDDFLGERKALAPLVGLSEDIRLGTNSWPESPQFDIYEPGHPIFRDVALPYTTGSGALASPQPGYDWSLTSSAVVLGRAMPEYMGFSGNGVIIAHETSSYRGLYFANYIENKSGGANPQDMQVFYNGLLWAAAPEPGTALLLVGGTILVVRRRLTRRL